MFRCRFFITYLLLCTLILNASAQEPTELHVNSQNLNEDSSIVSTSRSPFAKLHSIPPRVINLGDGFWKKRFSVNMDTSIPTFFTHLKNVGACDKLLGFKNKARGNSDADLAKWVEAASYVLQSESSKQLSDFLQDMVNDIKISGTNGNYLHARYLKKMPVRLAQFEAVGDLYCLGRLIQAGIAHYRATGNQQILNVLYPYIDNVIDLFGSNKQTCWSGHPEIEMALVELYRITGKRQYLDFVRCLLEEVGYRKIDRIQHIDFKHFFSGMPFTYCRKLSGHAVYALYACCGAADYYLESVDHRDVSIFNIVLPLNLSNIPSHFEVNYDSNLLGGIATITADALARALVLSDDSLYSFERFPKPSMPVKMIAIPDFAWANRDRSEMEVWIPWIAKQ